MENFVECSLDSELFFDDRNQHIDGDGNPDLSFHGIFGSAVERFDSKILLDPFEEQLDFPAALEKESNRQGWQDKVVRQENKTTVFFDIEETDSPEWVGIELRGFGTLEQNGLIAS